MHVSTTNSKIVITPNIVFDFAFEILVYGKVIKHSLVTPIEEQ